MSMPGEFPEIPSPPVTRSWSPSVSARSFQRRLLERTHNGKINHLVASFDTLTMLFLTYSYLKDCLLMNFCMRAGLHIMFLVAPFVSTGYERLFQEQKIFHFLLLLLICFTTLTSVALHVSLGLPQAQSHNGFVFNDRERLWTFGYSTIQVIGDELLPSKWILVALDVIVMASNIATLSLKVNAYNEVPQYARNFRKRSVIDLENTIPNHESLHNSFQGTDNVITLKPLSILRIKWPRTWHEYEVSPDNAPLLDSVAANYI